VPGDQPRLPVRFRYADESDPGPYPIPTNPAIEGGAAASGDRHILMVDRDNCKLYELFAAARESGGAWQAGSGAIFDLRSHALRPAGWTSADAAGLPILAGLVRYDEVASGEIRHAIRFTAPATRRAYIWPARHYASSRTGLEYPPMGQRFRLRADYDISGFPREVQVILRALQRYGLILADNGSPWFLTGVPDDRWDNLVMAEIKKVKGSALEAVDVSSLMINPNFAQARQTPAAVVNAADNVSGPVTPGLILSVYGPNIGPAAPAGPVWSAEGVLAREVAETTVAFDGVPAPVLFASPSQINTIVPFAAAGRAATSLQVRSRGRVVLEASLPVSAAAPALFTLDNSGAGPGAILNQDYTVNSASNPAPRGSIVMFFGTGGGQTDPPGTDGGIVRGSPAPLRTSVSARIAGLPADVLYAGAAPGLVAGVFQVNVRIPSDAVPGVAPVLLMVGGFPTQSGVTLALR
jgi:uncharacterized protein (TIGR03437 family)